MAEAIVVSRTGGPEVLEHVDREVPSPGPGELRVTVAAAGVNYIDTYHRDGLYPLPLPFVLGMEGAGTVAEVGEDCPGFTVGDRVAWADALGSYASEVIVRAAVAVPVPPEVELEVAAAAMLQGLTAHYLVTSTYHVRPVDTVLIHAAAGGVGLLLVQLCKARGARVLTTVSTEDKAELARGAGADEVILYTREDFAARTRELTDGEGVAVVYDGVGRTTFDGSLASLRRRGTLALFGAASGPVPPFDPQRLNQGGSLFLTRPKLADHTATEEELRWRSTDLFAAIDDGLDVRIGGRYPLAEAARAHQDLQGRRTTGKLLLVPGE